MIQTREVLFKCNCKLTIHNIEINKITHKGCNVIIRILNMKHRGHNC